MENKLQLGLESLSLTPPAGTEERLLTYRKLLLEKNQVMNLTAITDPDEVLSLHFLDSAALLNAGSFSGKSVIDVGTGAGFPGLVLQILEPSIRLTLLDSLKKRIDWLSIIAPILDCHHVDCFHARAEEQAYLPDFRDSFDIAVSRAVASLPTLVELCLPFVRPGGWFFAMKSDHCEEETSAAASAISRLNGKLATPFQYEIPGTDIRRTVIRIQKTGFTPAKFPRRFSKIQKNPL